jgi:hypothetical protein
MSISFRRTAEHYKPHFEALLRNLNYKDFGEFMESFPGNICDFSLMERNGFRKAVFEVYGTVEEEISDTQIEGVFVPNVLTKAEDLDLSKVYALCIVHFLRTAERVGSDYSLVPPHMRNMFDRYIHGVFLKEETTEEAFNEAVTQFKKDFKNLKRWIDCRVFFLHLGWKA